MFHVRSDVAIEAVGIPATCDAYSTPVLLRLITNDDLDPAQLVTHHFELDNIEHADDVFEHAADTGALKIVFTTDPHSA